MEAPPVLGFSSLSLRAALLLLLLRVHHAMVVAVPVPAADVPCTAGGECTDDEGTVWDLSMLGRVHRVAGTYNAGSGPRFDTFTYAFRLYANLGVVPDICTSSGVDTASAMRYDPVQRFPGGPPPSCTQIGPDMSSTPLYTITRVPMGLTFQYELSSGGDDTLTINLRCSEGAGVGLPDDAIWRQEAPGQFTINWRNGITCPGVSSPCTATGACTDDEGTVWQLGGPGLGQIQRIAGPISGQTYAFRLFANLNVVPEACIAAGITEASAMRYDGSGTDPESECIQIGPNINFDPTFEVRRLPDGLLFQYQFDSSIIRLNLLCREVRIQSLLAACVVCEDTARTVMTPATQIAARTMMAQGAGVGLPSAATETSPGELWIEWFNGLVCAPAVAASGQAAM